jgi:sugar phosphate isomerase/epimerase
MHDRLVVNQVSLPRGESLARHVARITGAGISRMGVFADKLEEAGWDTSVLADLEVPYLIHRIVFAEPGGSPADVARARRTIDAAAALGTPLVYMTTGPAGPLPWEEACDRFVDAFGPLAEHAAGAGVRLAVETTNPQFADIDFLHTFAATLELAERAGLAICFDVHAAWTEPRLAANIARAADRLALVQVSDYVPGTRALDRSVPGDGVIPLERILGAVLATGYDGPIDLELFGARTEDPMHAIERGLAYLDALLD